MGAGSAGCGVADGLADAITLGDPNITLRKALKNFYLLDVEGLVTKERKGLFPFQQ